MSSSLMSELEPRENSAWSEREQKRLDDCMLSYLKSTLFQTPDKSYIFSFIVCKMGLIMVPPT